MNDATAAITASAEDGVDPAAIAARVQVVSGVSLRNYLGWEAGRPLLPRANNATPTEEQQHREFLGIARLRRWRF
jgi:hypothetical protein